VTEQTFSVVKDNNLKTNTHLSYSWKDKLGVFNASCLSDTKKEVNSFNTFNCNAKPHTKPPRQIILMIVKYMLVSVSGRHNV